MKKNKFLALLVLSLILFSCTEEAQKKQSIVNTEKNTIEVIDFYSTHRCITCKAIEANTKYTLDTYFAKELENGEITFQTVNIDQEKNAVKAEAFEAAGTALFLNVRIGGKAKKINLTSFAFSKGRDKVAFSKALKAKIEQQLKKL